jgi:hypothetical protein
MPGVGRRSYGLGQRSTSWPRGFAGDGAMMSGNGWNRIEKKDAPKTRDILRRFQIDRIVESPFLSVDQRKYLEEHVDRVWLFDSLTKEVDDSTDALAILCKKMN